MKTTEDNEEISEKEWPVRPYYKRELAEAYAPNISTAAALNRLAKWQITNTELNTALLNTGYRCTQKIYTSMQVELIFKYLGRP